MAWWRNLRKLGRRKLDWHRLGWRKVDWRWVTLHGGALAIWGYVMTQGSEKWHQPSVGFDSMLESGKWGIRLLLLCLTMTPLHTYVGWKGALTLRKPLGLWAFAFCATHFGLYAVESWEPSPIYWTSGTPWHWLRWPMPLYVALGLMALLILTALAATSNRWSMRRLGKQWKRLHRLVYCAGIAILGHALLAAGMSKKMMVRDPQAVREMWLYMGVLVVLLLIRVPQVRAVFKRARPQVRPRVVPNVANMSPLPTPRPTTLPLPQVTPAPIADLPAPLAVGEVEDVDDEREMAY